ncbi:fatty-acid peroxygenase [Virgibacillus natechei]|uniref:Fatty-acid peroxygenase n=1 Tax=Virgibacillus natechei TaxID=1216297 RepID=A0ABS4IH74_9BACI|nr:cytochrome P450 [Virgibacillus natechei]MBP1970275.1 fatty-acid peroxygenase [Virgibacillus natechei]UZD12781.1 cytochrome P450 [Virgibacillus natechei]
MATTNTIPKEKGLDNSIKLMTEGYNFIPNRLRYFQSTIFQTRLLGQKAICISGEEAGALLYDNALFQRKGAAPMRIQKSLFGVGGVQGMDGAAHQHRKQLFMSLMTSQRLKVLHNLTVEQWEIATRKWENMHKVELFEEGEKIMCRVACQWAGVPLWAKELKLRSNDLAAMIDAFGAVGPRHWQGRTARNRTEKWIKYIIEQVRSGKMQAPEETALYAMSWHRDLNGNLLNLKTAAVELINIIRPIVAIARYITFGALALHQYPETGKKLVEDDGEYSQMFVQEIRRFYPFGPFTGARVRKDFTWNGYKFKQGTLVLLDIYGTNHSPDLWDNPDTFRPERFGNWSGSPFDFIPQGGGEYDIGHRCAGEWVTVEAMKTSLEFLTKRITYDVPPQDLNYSMVRMPSIPRSRFVIQHVRRK